MRRSFLPVSCSSSRPSSHLPEGEPEENHLTRPPSTRRNAFSRRSVRAASLNEDPTILPTANAIVRQQRRGAREGT
jgi:hypothetical protein